MASLINFTKAKEFGSVIATPYPIVLLPSAAISVSEQVFPGLPATGTTATSTALTALGDTSKIQIGTRVTGTGIAAGSYVTVIVSATAVTLSAATSASASGVALTWKDTVVEDRTKQPVTSFVAIETPAVILAAS